MRADDDACHEKPGDRSQAQMLEKHDHHGSYHEKNDCRYDKAFKIHRTRKSCVPSYGPGPRATSFGFYLPGIEQYRFFDETTKF